MSFSVEIYAETEVPDFMVVLWNRRTVVSHSDEEAEVSKARRRAVHTWLGSSLGRLSMRDRVVSSDDAYISE
jgi:hypothetical protein